MVSEIKELKENNQKDDDILLAISAGYKQPLAPHLEYQYPDLDVHEDVFKLIQYSCEEMCSTKEQLNKVMRLWTSFLEQMLGVSPRQHPPEGTDVAGKAKISSVNGAASSVGESDRSPEKCGNAADENSSPDFANSCRSGLPNGDNSTRKEPSGRACRDDMKVEKEQKTTDMSDKRPRLSVHGSSERISNSIASLANAAESSHGQNTTEGTSSLCSNQLMTLHI